jgi:hypothetical protein
MGMGQDKALIAYDLGEKAVQDGLNALMRVLSIAEPEIQPGILAVWGALMQSKISTLDLLAPGVAEIVTAMAPIGEKDLREKFGQMKGRG